MSRQVRKSTFAAVLAGLVLTFTLGTVQAAGKGDGTPVLWKAPASRDLFYGPGGRQNAPRCPCTFEKEDLDGTNPKFQVKDSRGVKWKVKLGLEARPETVATRLVWAAGYFATEDYLVGDTRIEGMPAHLHRGQKLVGPGGRIHDARFKKVPEGAKKIGTWSWKDDPYTGSREWNGLRVLMALINNWDLKDENNAIYREGSERVYLVSDLGTAFGTAGRSWPRDRAKDNLAWYGRSRFIRRTTADTVDFQSPARPMWVFLVNPKEYFHRLHLEPLGRDVPRADARWLGRLLGSLSQAQLRDAFRAGGYSPAEIDIAVRLLESRIAELTDL